MYKATYKSTIQSEVESQLRDSLQYSPNRLFTLNSACTYHCCKPSTKMISLNEINASFAFNILLTFVLLLMLTPKISNRLRGIAPPVKGASATLGGRIVARITVHSEPPSSFFGINTTGFQSHGAMASFRGKKKLICFYCNKRSGIVYDGLITQWECANCDAMNYLDQVFTSQVLDDHDANYSNRMVKSPILQLLRIMQHHQTAHMPFLNPTINPLLKAPTRLSFVQHVKRINTCTEHRCNNLTSSATHTIQTIGSPRKRTISTREISINATLRSAKTARQRRWNV